VCRSFAPQGTDDERTALSCLDLGAATFLTKSEGREHLVEATPAAADERPYMPPVLAGALGRNACADRPQLSAREEDLLIEWFQSESKELVAQRLGISVRTVNSYLDRVRIKYANVGRPARTKASLVARAIQDRLVDNIGEQSPGRRCRGARAEDPCLVPQYGQIRDGFAAVGEHHGQVGGDPARIMSGPARPKRPESGGARGGQPRGIGKIRQQPCPGMPDDPQTIGNDLDLGTQPDGLHVESALRLDRQNPSQGSSSQVRKALSRFRLNSRRTQAKRRGWRPESAVAGQQARAAFAQVRAPLTSWERPRRRPAELVDRATPPHPHPE
jgi:DNA-binding CsgD family transcriptional regulator